MKQLVKPITHAVLALGLAFSANTMAAPSKILFGSCGHQDKDIPIFDTINKEQGDLFIFLGDKKIIESFQNILSHLIRVAVLTHN